MKGMDSGSPKFYFRMNLADQNLFYFIFLHFNTNQDNEEENDSMNSDDDVSNSRKKAPLLFASCGSPRKKNEALGGEFDVEGEFLNSLVVLIRRFFPAFFLFKIIN